LGINLEQPTCKAEDEPKKEYEVIKNPTFGEVLDAVREADCSEAIEEYVRFNADVGTWAVDYSPKQTTFIATVIFEKFVFPHPKRVQFAIDHGWVREKEEPKKAPEKTPRRFDPETVNGRIRVKNKE
jgi:hypothetical protein